MLLFPPYWVRDNIAALNQSESTPKIVKVTENKPPEPQPTVSQYQDIKITREELISYLEETFIQYGLEDQIPTALKVAECESSFDIYADNGISFGIFQFTRPTWNDFGNGDIFNPQTQIVVTAKIVKKEGWGRWDCFTGKR